MTRVEIEDVDEGDTWAGYHTLRAEEQGELLLEVHVSPDVVDDVSDAVDMGLPDLYRFIADVMEEIDADGPAEYGPPNDGGAGDLFG